MVAKIEENGYYLRKNRMEGQGMLFSSKKKNHLISLGSNCEVSFRIQKFRKPFESSLFSWASTLDKWKFIDALWHLDDIFMNGIHFHLPTEDMFYDEKYDLVFHGRTPKSAMLSDDGMIIDQEKYEECVEELKSRLTHLKEKFKRDLESEEEKIYIRKVEAFPDWICQEFYEDTIRFIQELDKYFSINVRAGGYKLIIVMEEKYLTPEIKALEKECLYIRSVKYLASFQNTKNGADNVGWKKILKEFG